MSTSTSDFVDLSPRRHSLYERLAFESGDREGLAKRQMKQLPLQQQQQDGTSEELAWFSTSAACVSLDDTQ